MSGEERRLAAQPVFLRPRFYRLHNEADEAIALAAHPIHYFPPVDLGCSRHDAKARRQRQHMSSICGADEQLAWHAANPGTGGAIDATFNHHEAVGMRFGRAVGRHASTAGANDGNINLDTIHLRPLFASALQWPAARSVEIESTSTCERPIRTFGSTRLSTIVVRYRVASEPTARYAVRITSPGAGPLLDLGRYTSGASAQQRPSTSPTAADPSLHSP
ncbi:hypothetical protein D3C75_788080 [compost metagenome]